MIKIEVTGNSIPEVADKLLAIGASLRNSGMTNEYGTPLPEAVKPADTAPPKIKAVKEAKPVQETTIETVQIVAEEEVAFEKEPETTKPEAPAAVLNFETEVAPTVLEAVSKITKPRVSQILEEFGVERASMLDPMLWPELLNRLRAEMA